MILLFELLKCWYFRRVPSCPAGKVEFWIDQMVCLDWVSEFGVVLCAWILNPRARTVRWIEGERKFSQNLTPKVVLWLVHTHTHTRRERDKDFKRIQKQKQALILHKTVLGKKTIWTLETGLYFLKPQYLISQRTTVNNAPSKSTPTILERCYALSPDPPQIRKQDSFSLKQQNLTF